MTRLRSLLALFALSFVLVTSVLAWTYGPVAAAPAALSSAVLRISTDSLTEYLPDDGTAAQNLCLAAEQRGVGMNGVPQIPAPHGLMMGANPIESGGSCNSSRVLNGVDLVTGVFTDTQVYLNLPTLGSSWSIGATYSSASSCGSASDGYQGNNWAAFSAPEIVYEEDVNVVGDDFLYIVYGADRYVEFQRQRDEFDVETDFFLGVNGAGGVVEHDTGNDEYIYYDILGTEARFFDEDHPETTARGQLWKITSGSERTCVVGEVSNAKTRDNAKVAFHASGGPKMVHDGSGRRFTYSYEATTGRLDSVVSEVDPNGDHDWGDAEECGRVEFEYYDDTVDNQGSPGDLGLVKVTMPVNDSADLVTITHYRYYKDADTHGDDHEIKMVVQAEGVRRFAHDASLTPSLAVLDDELDADLYGYASHRFEYSSGKISSAWFTGDCGCSGGSEGEYEFTYGTQTPASSYDGQWTSRAVVKRPDDTYLTQYFDQVGQPLSTVITSHEPGTTPTPPEAMETWATRVERDGSGLVYEVATPANASSYNHASGAITAKSGSGLIYTTDHATAPTELAGFQESAGWKVGTTGGTGKSGTVAKWLYSTQSVSVPGSGPSVIQPVVDEYRDYSSATTFDATEYEYKWRSDGLHVEAMRTTYPAVPTSENGPGTSLEELQYYNSDEQLEYSKSTDGVISFYKYDAYGRMTASYEDAKYGEDSASEPLTGGTPPESDWDYSMVGSNQLRRETLYSYDCVGRVLETTLPSDRVTKRYYSVLADDRQVTLSYPKFVSGTGTFHGPVSYTVTNHAGKVEESGRLGLEGNSTDEVIADHVDETKESVMNAFKLISDSQLVRRRRSVFNETGTKRLESHLYFDLSFSGSNGAEGTHYDATYYHHDEMGRQVRVEEPSGTIYRTEYDVLGRAVQTNVGTNDYGLDGSDNTSGPANLVVINYTEYDDGNDGGNSLVTSTVEVEDEGKTQTRTTEYHYDQRDRLSLIESPTKPYTFYGLDYRGRRIATGLFSSTNGIDLGDTGKDDPDEVTTGRLRLATQGYDKLGRVWKSTRYEIVQSTGAKGTNLVAKSWYDDAGRLIKHQGGEFYKLEYDRIGRVFNRYELAELDATEAANHAYADADDVSGDIVLEESQLRYDEEGNVTLSATIMRHHNDKSAPTGGETKGALDTNGDTNDAKLTIGDLEGRAHIMAKWYDELGRLDTSAAYGTFDDSTFDRGSEPKPTATVSHSTTSALVVVTKYEYGIDGAIETFTDESGTPNFTERDAAGRVTAEICNYDSVTDGAPDDDYPDVNIRVNYTYENGLRTEYIAAREQSADDQVTTYVYGTDKGDESEITTGHLLRRIIYPDGDTVNDNVTYAYNAQGEQIYRKDQAENVLERVYDDSGRLLDLKATAINAGFNGDVKRISRTYDDLGRTLTVKQYDAVTGGAILDEVSFTYDDWGMRENFTQDVNGAATGGVFTLTNKWEKASIGRQALRLKKQEYPSGNFMEPYYGSTHNLFDDSVSRATAIKVGKSGQSSGTLQVSYDYLGSDWAVRTEYLALAVQRSLHNGAGTPSYDALDSLGRITHDRWEKVNGGGNDVMFYDVELTYQGSENVLNHAVDNVTTGFDVDFGHDAAQRLTKADEGTLDANGEIYVDTNVIPNVTHRSRYQDWELDALGNWENMRLGLDSDLVFTGTGELDEGREHNKVNELTKRGASINLVHDKVGNLIDDGEDYKYKYDVFGRQTSVFDQGDVEIANYKYNGLGYLIQEEEDAGSGDWLHYVYDGSWRVVAKYLDSSAVAEPDEEYFYHRAGRDGLGGSSYIDLVALRDRDTDSGSFGLEERVYYCQDRLANVVVVLTGGGSVLEWIRYSAYGVPFMSPPGDMDGNGTVTSGDLITIGEMIDLGQDPVKADIDLDGDVTRAEAGEIQTLFKDAAFGPDVLSWVENEIGFKGYARTSHDASAWLARSRRLDSKRGVWISRDPTRYGDGSNMYRAFRGNPLRYNDLSGETSVNMRAEMFGGGAAVPKYRWETIVDEDGVEKTPTRDGTGWIRRKGWMSDEEWENLIRTNWEFREFIIDELEGEFDREWRRKLADDVGYGAGSRALHDIGMLLGVDDEEGDVVGGIFIANAGAYRIPAPRAPWMPKFPKGIGTRLLSGGGVGGGMTSTAARGVATRAGVFGLTCGLLYTLLRNPSWEELTMSDMGHTPGRGHRRKSDPAKTRRFQRRAAAAAAAAAEALRQRWAEWRNMDPEVRRLTGTEKPPGEDPDPDGVGD